MKESDECDKAVRQLTETLKYLETGKELIEFSPQRIPLVDQALELANFMKEINAPKELVEELLNVAVKAYRQISTPIYIIKDKNENNSN